MSRDCTSDKSVSGDACMISSFLLGCDGLCVAAAARLVLRDSSATTDSAVIRNGAIMALSVNGFFLDPLCRMFVSLYVRKHTFTITLQRREASCPPWGSAAAAQKPRCRSSQDGWEHEETDEKENENDDVMIDED